MLKFSDRLKSYAPFFGVYLPEGGNLFSAFVSSDSNGIVYRVHNYFMTDETATLFAVTAKDASFYEKLFYQIQLQINNENENISFFSDMKIIPVPGTEINDVLILIKPEFMELGAFLRNLFNVLRNGSEEGKTERRGNTLQLNIKGNGENKLFEIDSFPCIIGRGGSCGIRLNSGFVSKKHCVIDMLPDKTYCISDLNSMNKTKLNWVELVPERKYTLVRGDIIILSDYSITAI